MKPTAQKQPIEQAVREVLASTQEAQDWHQSDMNAFIREVEFIKHIKLPQAWNRAKEHLIGMLAFHYTTSLSPKPDEIENYRDIATQNVDQIFTKLGIAAPGISTGTFRSGI